ncbi:hypothetical protein CFIICLFH_1865 [Methylobacterium goesingense]|uniref:Uncharacterized protein n=1 Tax=Methylobacterium goesingense TaxID=243690 RepID=A0ABV2L7B2_9HYPH|nr:hypothetical protein CFIICLFH_1865 [Methylobacterium goesingense]
MSMRRSCAALAVFGAVLIGGAADGAQAANRSGLFQAKAHRYSCRPPLKFAAGACVKRCPAGYRDTGRYCRFRNMSR